MRKPKIDLKDIQILSMFSQNPRISNRELSQKIGLTEPSTLKRAENLINGNFIERFKVLFNYKLFGYKLSEGVFLHCMEKDVIELTKRATNSNLVVTLLHFNTGDKIEGNWLLLIIVGKNQDQIDMELNSIYKDINLFKAAGFKNPRLLKCNEFKLSPSDLVK